MYGNDFSLKLDSNLKVEISTILSLYVFNKSNIEKNYSNNEYIVRIKDHWLNFYIKYFKKAIDKNYKTDLIELGKILSCINNIIDDKD